MSEEIRRKLLFHIKEVSERDHPDLSKTGIYELTPRSFHVDILPKFPISLRGTVTTMFFEMTEIYTKKWVYHRLKKEWANA